MGTVLRFLANYQHDWQRNRPHECINRWGIRKKNGIKFFATSELVELMKNRTWLIKVTNAVNHYWQRNNVAKKNCLAKDSQNKDVKSAKSEGRVN